jgi:hydrogenase large subunit
LNTKQLIEKIEGEASIYFDIVDDKVDFCTISFAHFRAMEDILKNKPAFDALVITPRVCGICGHSHLMATVRAIEDAYTNANKQLHLTKKAKNIRELTLILEIIQNHYKWIYLTLIPELNKLSSSKLSNTPLKGAYAASLVSKAIATFAGQWPHSSYMIAGGVTCDPTHIDKIQAKNFICELIAFFEKESIGTTLDDFLAFESCKDFNKLESDVSQIEALLIKLDMHKKGFAHDRFMVLAEHSFTLASKLKQTRRFSVNPKFVSTENSYSPHEHSYAKNALYRDDFYETGSLARAISNNTTIIKNMHRRYKDSTYSRIMARVFELAQLLKHSLKLIDEIDISQESWIKPANIETISATGIGIVEAPRGPLIHKIELINGIIKEYKIITPTQWNIGSSTKNSPSPAQQAMIGNNKQEAQFIFRSFDVCSVCTTH